VREIDDPSGIVEQRQRVRLRQAAQPLDQEVVDLLASQALAELLRIGDAGG